MLSLDNYYTRSKGIGYITLLSTSAGPKKESFLGPKILNKLGSTYKQLQLQFISRTIFFFEKLQ